MRSWIFNLFLALALIAHPYKCEGQEKKVQSQNKQKIVLSEDSLKIWNEWIEKTIKESDSLNCPAIIVRKLDKKLDLYIDGKKDTSFEIFLFDYFYPKTHIGDGLTPEGRYYATYFGEHPYFKYVIQISYPDTSIAKRGLEKGIITKQEYEQIKKAIKQGKKPPMNTALGGDICIHGTKASIGCIAIDTAIDYLYNKIKNFKKILITIVRGTKPEYSVKNYP